MIRNTEVGWLLSSQDLTAYIGCRHAAELNRRVHTDPAVRDWLVSANREAHVRVQATGLPAVDPSVSRGLA